MISEPPLKKENLPSNAPKHLSSAEALIISPSFSICVKHQKTRPFFAFLHLLLFFFFSPKQAGF